MRNLQVCTVILIPGPILGIKEMLRMMIKTFQTSNVCDLNSFVEMRITNLIGLLDFSFAIPIYKEMAINESKIQNEKTKT